MNSVEPVTAVTVFDLDGTLTDRDTLLAFLVACLRREPWRVWRLWRLPFTLARFALGLSGRGRLKASLIRQVLGGRRREEIEKRAAAFCAEILPGMILAPALEALERHRRDGDRLVLMSASVDLYVPRIAAQLGFHEAICTEVSWSAGRLNGRLASANRRGREKARCLQALRARHPGALIAAYGNSLSDLEHLLLADRGFLVNGDRRAVQAASRHALPCLEWRT